MIWEAHYMSTQSVLLIIHVLMSLKFYPVLPQFFIFKEQKRNTCNIVCFKIIIICRAVT